MFFLAVISCALLFASVEPHEPVNQRCELSLYTTHYYDLNCKPIFEGDKSCPSRFDCRDFENRDPNKCYHNGKEYEVDSILERDPHCLAVCRCRKDFNGRVGFLCATVECPELFLGPLDNPSCFRQYAPDRCCSTGTLCTQNTTGVFKCHYKGNTYLEGQPITVDEPCKSCYCQKGFDGRISEPWCSDIECNTDIHNIDAIKKGCVPVYLDGSCCPIDMLCPSENDAVVPNDDSDVLSGKGECIFGSLQFRVGDKLSKRPSCGECECKVPPYLTCVKRNCTK